MNDNKVRITDKHIFFWFGWPSNWYPSKFTAIVDDIEYTFGNAEQYFMFMKAKYFHDDYMAEQIIKNGGNPKEAKRLGRLVNGFDGEKWDKVKFNYMVEANYLKYTQNPNLLNQLLDKNLLDKHFVEGSPYDKIWGIGVEYQVASDDESTWNGQNLLGKALDKVREMLLDK
jgi:ribA/ribD-fused uncharacterized protein